MPSFKPGDVVVFRLDAPWSERAVGWRGRVVEMDRVNLAYRRPGAVCVIWFEQGPASPLSGGNFPMVKGRKEPDIAVHQESDLRFWSAVDALGRVVDTNGNGG